MAASAAEQLLRKCRLETTDSDLLLRDVVVFVGYVGLD